LAKRQQSLEDNKRRLAEAEQKRMEEAKAVAAKRKAEKEEAAK
jgi:hypothetical protein